MNGLRLVNQYFRLRHAEPVPAEKIDRDSYYIPIHACARVGALRPRSGSYSTFLRRVRQGHRSMTNFLLDPQSMHPWLTPWYVFEYTRLPWRPTYPRCAVQSSYLNTIGIFAGFHGEGIRNLYIRLLNIRCLHIVFRSQCGFEVERLRQLNGIPSGFEGNAGTFLCRRRSSGSIFHRRRNSGSRRIAAPIFARRIRNWESGKLAKRQLMAPEHTGPRIRQLCLIMIQLMYVLHDWMVDYCI